VFVSSNVLKQYGRQVLFTDLSFQINPGEKAGLVGPNGCGKTTLFRLIKGMERPDEGTMLFVSHDTVILR
jgi:ATP-binding cassette, subfamily F, member 3